MLIICWSYLIINIIVVLKIWSFQATFHSCFLQLVLLLNILWNVVMNMTFSFWFNLYSLPISHILEVWIFLLEVFPWSLELGLRLVLFATKFQGSIPRQREPYFSLGWFQCCGGDDDCRFVSDGLVSNIFDVAYPGVHGCISPLFLGHFDNVTRISWICFIVRVWQLFLPMIFFFRWSSCRAWELD